MKITDIRARQILDSRGNPTVEADAARFSAKKSAQPATKPNR